MRLTFLLFILPFFAFSQDIDKAIKHLETSKAQIDSAIAALTPKPVVKTYVPYPSAPVFVDPVTITTTAAGFNIDDKKLAGKLDVQFTDGQTANVSGTWTKGTKDAPVRLKGNKTIIGDGSLDGKKACFATITYPRHTQLFGFIFYRNHGAVNAAGGDAANPTGIEIHDVQDYNSTFASLWINNELKHYDKINTSFYRNWNSAGEFMYVGSTKKTALSVIRQSHHAHIFSDGAGWDGLQFTAVSDLHITNATILNSGRLNVAGQNRQAQFHFDNGIVEKSIFIGGAQMELFSNGLTIQNSYFEWGLADMIYVGNYAAGHPNLNGQPVIFDGDTFVAPGDNPVFEVGMLNADIIVKNCTIAGNRKGLFKDVRGAGATNKLIDGGGNKFVPIDQIKRPVLVPEPDYIEVKGITKPALVVADDYYYNLGLGHRTPSK